MSITPIQKAFKYFQVKSGWLGTAFYRRMGKRYIPNINLIPIQAKDLLFSVANCDKPSNGAAIYKKTKATGQVMPDAFTHGTSAQRMYWFKKGFETGDMGQGDTFADAGLR